MYQIGHVTPYVDMLGLGMVVSSGLCTYSMFKCACCRSQMGAYACDSECMSSDVEEHVSACPYGRAFVKF